MGLFYQDASKANGFDRLCAIELRQALVRRASLVRPYSLKSWADHFRKLRQVDALDDGVIEEVLEWYCRNISNKYVPLAYSAKSFREKWPAIREAFKRDRQKNPVTAASDRAKKITGRLLNQLIWPMGCEKKLLVSVQMALDEVTDFRSRLSDYINGKSIGLSHGRSLERIARMLYEALGPHLVEEWFRDVHRQIQKWKDWSGDFSPFYFTHDSKAFNRRGQGLVAGYSGSSGGWNDLMEELYAD